MRRSEITQDKPTEIKLDAEVRFNDKDKANKVKTESKPYNKYFF